MFSLLQKIQKNLAWVIPIIMVIGFFIGQTFDISFFKKLILPITFLMVYPMMINLPLKKLLDKGGEKVQIGTQFINFLFIPIIAFAIGKLFFRDNSYLVLGMLLIGLIPTSGMTIAWTGMAKGNKLAAIKMTIIGLFLGALLTPLFSKLLLGESVEIPIFKISIQIISVVFLPLLLGNITQRFLIKKYGAEVFQNSIKGKLSSLSTIGVVIMVLMAVALKSKMIASNPTMLLSLLPPLLLFYVVIFSLSSIVGKMFLKREDAIALVFGTAMRNLSIALAIAMMAFGKKGSDVALIISIAYVIQIQAAVWYMKLVKPLFGEISNN